MRNLILSLLLLIIFHSTFAQSNVIDSLKTVLSSAAADTNKVVVLNQLAKAYDFVEYDSMFAYCTRAKILAEKLNYKKGLARALSTTGVYYSRIDAPKETSLSYFNQSLAIVDPHDSVLNMTLLYSIATLSDDKNVATSNIKKAIGIAKKIKYRQIGFMYNGLGALSFNQSNHQQALSYFLQGLTAAEKFHDSIAMSLNLAGVIEVLDHNNDEDTYKYLMQAIDISAKIKSNELMAISKSALSRHYYFHGKLDSAMMMASEALALAYKVNAPALIGKNLNNVAFMYHHQKKYQEALAYYKKALSYQQQGLSDMDLSNAYSNMGETYNALGKYHEAINSMQKGLALNLPTRSKTQLINSYRELAKAYSKISNYKKAYEYHELYFVMQDSVYNAEASKQMAALETKYQVEKKDKDIKDLKQRNQIKDLTISQNNIKLWLMYAFCILVVIITTLLFNQYRIKTRANKEKEVLMTEIHHRVKNNLQLLSSLLSWQTENIEDEKMLKILGESKSRIKSISLIHELLYQSDNFAQLELKSYLIKLLDSLEKIYNTDKRIAVIKTIEPILVDLDVTIPLGLIVTELVSNIFKYAFPGDKAGVIEIVLVAGEAYCQLQVKDNGVGMPQHVWLQKNRKSMGLELVKILVKQIKGDLDFKNDNGTTFTISFSNISYQQKAETKKLADTVSAI